MVSDWNYGVKEEVVGPPGETEISAGMVLGRAWIHRLPKKSDLGRFREGHEFTRAAKSLKIYPRFSA
jgi:hypothetical protein